MHKTIMPRPDIPRPAMAACPEEERAQRTVQKVVKLVYALSTKEQELALILLQTIAAWNGLKEREGPSRP